MCGRWRCMWTIAVIRMIGVCRFCASLCSHLFPLETVAKRIRSSCVSDSFSPIIGGALLQHILSLFSTLFCRSRCYFRLRRTIFLSHSMFMANGIWVGWLMATFTWGTAHAPMHVHVARSATAAGGGGVVDFGRNVGIGAYPFLDAFFSFFPQRISFFLFPGIIFHPCLILFIELSAENTTKLQLHHTQQACSLRIDSIVISRIKRKSVSFHLTT